MEASVGVAERDVVEPDPVGIRLEIGRRLLVGAGFELRAAQGDVSGDDPRAIAGLLRARSN